MATFTAEDLGRPFVTVADALGAGDSVEALAVLFQDLAQAGASVPELVAAAAYLATERLPRGMSLTDKRPGCWESSCFEPMIPESAVMAGPGAEPLDVDCNRCGSTPGNSCWNPKTYEDNERPHRERVATAKLMTVYAAGYGWTC